MNLHPIGRYGLKETETLATMILLEIVFLAIVQGVTEFLPVSSSGHLVVLAALFEQFGINIQERLTVNIVLHVGTLLAIVVFYWRRILALLGQDRRVIGLIIVGSVPAAVVGLFLKSYFTETLEHPLTAGLMFPITAAMLLWTTRHKSGELSCRDLSYSHALFIGLFQAFAILPGISRSGSSIVAGLGVGLKRNEAATFSFLLAIPVLSGAGLLEGIAIAGGANGSVPIFVLIVGALVSFVVGLASLFWLIKWLEKGRLYWFAWWLLILAPIVLVWQLI